jgi:CheY-like chemotaxis protein/CheY-specific phosphatase CheX
MVQALRTLIIDDSPTDRQTLTYLLTRKLGCEVETASDGLEALDKLSRQRFDVAFLDFLMPFMSGLEVLQAIRSCPETCNLPVVVISGQSDPKTVRALVQLKIFDYVLKPYNTETVVKRFSRSLPKLRLAACVSPAVGPPGWESGEQEGKTSVLIADEDANFRHFFVATLGSQVHVIEAANGAQAAAAALGHNPSFVFAGSKLGTYGRDAMVAKLRSLNGLGRMRIYALIQDGEIPLTTGLYDGAVVRSFVPEIFLDSLKSALPSGFVPGKRVPVLAEQLKPALVSATEQVFGMMMSAEVAVVDHAAPPEPPAPAIVAAVDLISYAEERRISVALSCTRECAITIASRMLGEELPADSEDLVTSSLAEVMNIIAGRLKNTLGEQGRDFFSALPQVTQAARGGAEAHASVLEFEAERDLRFFIALFVEICSKSRVSKVNLREGLVLAQTVDVKGLGRLAKGLRLDGETAAKLNVYGPREVEVFSGI